MLSSSWSQRFQVQYKEWPVTFTCRKRDILRKVKIKKNVMKVFGQLEAQYIQNSTRDRYHSLIKQINILHIFSKSKSSSGELKTVTQLSISEITPSGLINTRLLSLLHCVRGISVLSLIFCVRVQFYCQSSALCSLYACWLPFPKS